MNLSEPFIRKPVMTAVLTISVIVFGVLSYLRLPVNDLPVVDYPVISVQANYPGASPDTVANNIATPLERQFMQINGLELVTSQSTQGHVSFTLQFALDKSIDAAATDVQTAISQATGNLPTDLPSPPTYSKTNPNDQPILYIALTSDSVTGGRLYDYGSTQVGQRISILPGVSSVNVFGTKSAVRIKVDPSKMWARGISIDDLTNAVKNGTSYTGAGQFDSSSGTALLQPKGQLENAAAYGNLIVNSTSAGPVYLRDVADTEDSVQDERIRMKFWVRGYGEPSATVVVAVNRQAGSNAVAVAKSVRDLLPIISAELPGSVRVTPIYDRSQTIVNSVADVQATLMFAFVLVVAVIFVFLGRATDTLIPAVALPLSLLLTFMAMRIFGYSLDNLSLMALTLAIGFLVDDAIVFLENTVRLMEKGMKPLEASLESAREISFTILSMTVSLAAVFFPLVFMSGLVGRIFREFAVTIVISIFASGLVSLTLTPLMTSRMLADRGHGAKQTWMERTVGRIEKRVLAFYGRSLDWFLRRRWISAGIWVVCLAGTVVLFIVVPKTFLPPGDSGVVNGVFIAQEGSSPQQMFALQEAVSKAIREDPAVDRSISVTGLSAFLSSNQGLTYVFLKPDKRPPNSEVAGRLMGRIAGIPGVFPFLRPYPVLQISTGATSQNQGQYAFSISGVNAGQVYDVATKLMGKLRDYPGFATLSSDFFNNTPNLDIGIEHCTEPDGAIRKLTRERFEAVIIDCTDQKTAAQVLKSARSAPCNKRAIAVAIMDGHTGLRSAFDMGAHFVLYKPVSSERAKSSFRAARALMKRERRRNTRIGIELPVALNNHQTGFSQRVVTTDLSEGGMALHFEGTLARNPISKVRFTLPNTKIAMEPKGEIAWADGLDRAGIKFVEVPDRSREQLEEWVLRRIGEEARSIR